MRLYSQQGNMKQQKWVLLVALALVWGSSFILIKKGLAGLSPIQVGASRIVFAALFLMLIGANQVTKVPSFKWKYIALTSLFGTFIPAFLFATAQVYISSTVSAVLNSLTPLNTFIIGIIGFGATFVRRQMLGVVIGLSGSLILILNGAANHPEQDYRFAAFIVIASVCYAINVNLINKFLSDIPPFTITVGNFAVMLVPASIVLACTGIHANISDESVLNALFFVAILGIVGTGLANIVFFKLIQISSPVFATSVTYLIPVVAFFFFFFDGESLTLIQLLGAAVVLSGVYLAAKKL